MAEKTQPSDSNTEGFPAEYYAASLAELIHKLNNIITVLSGALRVIAPRTQSQGRHFTAGSTDFSRSAAVVPLYRRNRGC